MGKVLDMQGHEVERDAPSRNPVIAHILEELYQLNDQGMLDALMVAAVRVDGAPISYATPPVTCNLATCLGAMELTKKFYTDNLFLKLQPTSPSPSPKPPAA